MEKPKISLYWYCQIFGWGCAAIYWSYFAFIRKEVPISTSLLSVALGYVAAILASHGYKLLSHRYHWHLKPIKELLPIMLLGTILLAIIYTVFNFIINTSLYQLPLTRSTFNNILPGMTSGGLRYNAIWILAFHLYHYAKREAASEIEKTKLENEAIKAQLHQLTAELNPHFLFNSLNSIKALVNYQPEEARHAIVLLSEILRHALQMTKKESVPLSEELEQVEKYLQLEKIRFEERLTYHFDISEEAKTATILPFSLFNLVENAIKHGISQNASGGKISISAHIVGDNINLEVNNTGQLQKIADDNKGIGIKNIKERLQLLYGAKAHFDLFNKNNNQVTAIIQIPLFNA